MYIGDPPHYVMLEIPRDEPRTAKIMKYGTAHINIIMRKLILFMHDVMVLEQRDMDELTISSIDISSYEVKYTPLVSIHTHRVVCA